MKPGVYPELTMAEYLRLPAVSASILRAGIDTCPRAAWWESWLNPSGVEDHTDLTDAGTIAHEILLEGSFDCCAVIDPREHPAEKTGAIPNGWTNKSIRAARDAAREAGKIPVLAPAIAEIHAMVGAARAYIASLEHTEPAIWEAFSPAGGTSEMSVVWDDDGTLCRIRPDRTSLNRRIVIDAKFTSASAEPDAWGRNHMIGDGSYVGAAFYRRGFERTFGVTPDYVYLVTETRAPYLSALVGVTPAALALGETKVASGLELWKRCVARDRWPGYPNRVAYPEMPAWETAKWETRELAGVDYERGLASQP